MPFVMFDIFGAVSYAATKPDEFWSPTLNTPFVQRANGKAERRSGFLN
jgi:hypothetical protein